MNEDCLFCNIADHRIPANICVENDLIVAFDDIVPQAPVHKLIIPKQHIATLNDLTEADQSLIGELVLTAKQLASELELDEGYRILMNCGDHGGQTVYHIHLHLLGGRRLQWPPG